MSKKIVLNSFFAIVMVGFVLSFSSCQKDEKKIIGTWMLEKVEVKDFACADPLMTTELKPLVQQIVGGSGNEFEFTKDDKAIFGNAYGKIVATYKVNDSKLIMTFSDGSVETYELSFPDKKTMQWAIDANKDMLEELSENLEFLAELYDLYFDDEIKVTKCAFRFTFIKK